MLNRVSSRIGDIFVYFQIHLCIEFSRQQGSLFNEQYILIAFPSMFQVFDYTAWFSCEESLKPMP